MQHATTQTLRAVSSVICRVVLLGIALPVLLADFPDYVLPSRLTQDWSMLVTCDALALLAPLLRWRKLAFLAGVLALGVHYYFRHYVPTLDMAYMGVAIVFVLLPGSNRASVKKRGPSTRTSPVTGRR
ncbi:MAG: hypothetical protein ABSA94_10985 [Acidobacteriaceae bacterium]